MLVVPEIDQLGVQTIQAYESRLRARIKVLYDNLEGIYPAMNLAISSSSGLFTIFLNAGDEVSEFFNSKEFSRELENVKNNWIIIHPMLSWSAIHIDNVKQVEDFFSQKNNAFISHQAVLFRTKMLRSFGGYNSTYKVIGDTALMYEFFRKGEPFISKLNFSKVEAPNFASANQRRSRVEYLHLILFKYQFHLKRIAILNFIKREALFLYRKVRAYNEF